VGSAQGRCAELKGTAAASLAVKLLEKDNKTAQGRDTRLVFALADAYRRSGDGKKASATLQTVISADALHANLGLGRLALAAGDSAGAEAAYRAALTAWAKQAYGADDHTDARVGPRSRAALRKGVADARGDLAGGHRRRSAISEARSGCAGLPGPKRQRQSPRPGRARTDLDDRYAEAYALLGDLWKGDSKDKARAAYRISRGRARRTAGQQSEKSPGPL